MQFTWADDEKNRKNSRKTAEKLCIEYDNCANRAPLSPEIYKWVDEMILQLPSMYFPPSLSPLYHQ